MSVIRVTEESLIADEHNQLLVNVVMEHIEIPLRTIVALDGLLADNVEGYVAKQIATAATEDAAVDLVTSALAMMTAMWEVAGLNLNIGTGRPTSPEVDAWCERFLNHALTHAKMRLFELRLDYALNVGSIPLKTGESND
jgi:hypothetical protein